MTAKLGKSEVTNIDETYFLWNKNICISNDTKIDSTIIERRGHSLQRTWLADGRTDRRLGRQN